MIPSINRIRKVCKQIDKNKPFVLICPVGRYLGFSAPTSPAESMAEVAQRWGLPFCAVDPQRIIIKASNDTLALYYEDNLLQGSVFWGFGHEYLDRQMVRFIMYALEKMHAPVINGFNALTISDDKALMAIKLAESGLPVATSLIASARGNGSHILSLLHLTKKKNQRVIQKISGFSGGGVGTLPLPASIDYITPALWASRMDSRPRIIQNDLDGSSDTARRSVIRAYVVGGRVVGAYTTEAFGIINCAGLGRESVGKVYNLNHRESEIITKAAKEVYAEGYCRVDLSGNGTCAIYEVNPLARIDAEKYSLNIQEELMWYGVQLAFKKYETS